MINAVGRDIPEELLVNGKEVYQGKFYMDGKYMQKAAPKTRRYEKPAESKIVATLVDALKQCGAKDGMTFSFHHHLRNGDYVANMVMKAAIEGLTRPDGTRPILIAVTQLTSTDAAALKNELLIDVPMAETVMRYAKNAANCGLDGVVCSPLEAAIVKENCGENFLTVTPGIRFADSAVGDQKRIMTPEKAAHSGCDYLVMGRPITQAEDPVAAYRRALKDFLG